MANHYCYVTFLLNHTENFKGEIYVDGNFENEGTWIVK